MEIGIGRGVAAIVPIASKSSSRFLRYALISSNWQLDKAATGSTFDAVSRNDVRSVTIAQWSIVDQSLIVRYLDNADLRIARAIQAKSNLIHLLRERRASIETELLFGGTWADTSQVWCGPGRSGWRSLPARALFDEVIERDAVDLPMLSVTISRGVILQSEYMRTTRSKKDQSRSDRSQYKVAQPGDIIYNKMRAWQGAAGVTMHKGIVSPAYVVVRPRSDADPSYFGRVMRTEQFAREAERWSYGITSDMWSLRPHHFKTIQFLVPPLAEQIKIVEDLSSRTAELDKAVAAAEREIALLREYRTRLIADVVTGKKDVRAEAASLPDIDPLELASVLSGVVSSEEEEVGDADAD